MTTSQRGADPYLAIGHAIDEALAATRYSQAQFAAEVARREGRPRPYSQSLVGSWIRAQKPPSLDQLAAMEQVLALRTGTLTRILGWVPADTVPALDVGAALDADAGLMPTQRRALRDAWMEARLHTAEARRRKAERSRP